MDGLKTAGSKETSSTVRKQWRRVSGKASGRKSQFWQSHSFMGREKAEAYLYFPIIIFPYIILTLSWQVWSCKESGIEHIIHFFLTFPNSDSNSATKSKIYIISFSPLLVPSCTITSSVFHTELISSQLTSLQQRTKHHCPQTYSQNCDRELKYSGLFFL